MTEKDHHSDPFRLVEAARTAPDDRVPALFAVSGRQDLTLRPLVTQRSPTTRVTCGNSKIAHQRGAVQGRSGHLDAYTCSRSAPPLQSMTMICARSLGGSFASQSRRALRHHGTASTRGHQPPGPVRVLGWTADRLARVHVHDRGSRPIPATAGYQRPSPRLDHGQRPRPSMTNARATGPLGVRRGVRGLPHRPLRLPPRRPRVSYVVDTDVASAILKGQLSAGLARRLADQQLATTFVTVGELTQWTYLHRWGHAAASRSPGVLRQRRRPTVQLPSRHHLGRDPGTRAAPRDNELIPRAAPHST
jgi:hypothetical protein